MNAAMRFSIRKGEFMREGRSKSVRYESESLIKVRSKKGSVKYSVCVSGVSGA